MSALKYRWLAAALALSGCIGTETGNPPFAPGVGGDSGGMMTIVPTPSIERGWIAVDELAFVSCAEGDEGLIVRSEPGALALFGESELETEPVLEEGDYCGLRFERAEWTASEPSALTGATLAIDARQPNGMPLRIRSTQTGSIALLASEPFEMTPGAGGLLLFLDGPLLFNGLSLRDAEREPDGAIVLSAEKNPALLDQIEAQLPSALALYRDQDGDGALSMEERAAGPLAAPIP